MENHFFSKTIEEQLNILNEEDFFNKNELEQIKYLRQKGFFDTDFDIEKRIEFLEKIGAFNLDVNDDPETIPLTLDKVDYLNKKLSSKIKREIAYGSAVRFTKKIIKGKQLIIKDIIGIENLKNMDGGAIVTCNHFNPFDCFAVEAVFRMARKKRKRRIYKIIREGNYTNFPGLYGFFFKNCDTLPLASNKSVMKEFMKAVEVILKRKEMILIYPEQSMWFNYRKPKPLQNGAYRIAAKNNVPVIPIFITFEQVEGNPVDEYTIHIEEPIYPKEDLSQKDNEKYLKDKNYEVWKNIYEKTYNEKLTYNTVNNSKIEEINGK